MLSSAEIHKIIRVGGLAVTVALATCLAVTRIFGAENRYGLFEVNAINVSVFDDDVACEESGDCPVVKKKPITRRQTVAKRMQWLFGKRTRVSRTNR